MRTYELMFILRSDMADEDIAKQISTFETNFTAAGGTVKSSERMGKRRLAYKVRGFNEGEYILLTLEGGGAALHELERRMRVTEPVIKFLTVRVDEEQKRVEKVRKIRATRVKRKPEPPPAPAEAAPPNAAPAESVKPGEPAAAASPSEAPAVNA